MNDDLTHPASSAFVFTDDTRDPAVQRRIEHAEAAFIGALPGDALGWRAETGGARLGPVGASFEVSAWRFTGTTEEVDAGGTSDDSQLTLAVARARIHGGLEGSSDWWPVWTETELPLWGLYERGGGRATRAAATSWALERAPWDLDDHGALKAYFHAGGNHAQGRGRGAERRRAPHRCGRRGQLSALCRRRHAPRPLQGRARRDQRAHRDRRHGDPSR